MPLTLVVSDDTDKHVYNASVVYADQEYLQGPTTTKRQTGWEANLPKTVKKECSLTLLLSFKI